MEGKPVKNNLLRDKSYNFSVRITNMHQFLTKKQHEFVLSKQVLRSGTAIGALIMESEYAQSKADFINKLSIALKEANETSYWLTLLKDSHFINEPSYYSIQHDCEELLKMLTKSIITAKQNQSQKR
jgi:four helix bundle protein